MNQPPPNSPGGPYQGPPQGMPPTGGQPPMGPPPPGGMPPGGMPPVGGQPPMGPPPGGMPPGGPYGGGPYGGDPYGANPQGGPYGGGYGQPPAAKKSSPWLWISLGCGGLFVIGVVLVVLLVFVFSDSGDDNSSSSSSGPAVSEESEEPGGSGGASPTSTGLGNAERSNPGMPGMNEQVEHNDMLFTIVEVETGVTEVGGYTPIHEYVVMHVEVEPAGNEDIEFWRDEQHLYTYSGQNIGEHYNATRYYDETPVGVEIAPGESVVVAIVFDVEDPSDISHMGLSAEYLGGDEIDVDVTG